MSPINRRKPVARQFVYPVIALLEGSAQAIEEQKLPTDEDLDRTLRAAGLCDHHAPALVPPCSLCVGRNLPKRVVEGEAY